MFHFSIRIYDDRSESTNKLQHDPGVHFLWVGNQKSSRDLQVSMNSLRV